jgi:SAM-dependent methyltransferase
MLAGWKQNLAASQAPRRRIHYCNSRKWRSHTNGVYANRKRMTLAEDYKKQFGWRSWQSIFEVLPSLQGKTILDLGCAVGDQAAELVSRGAQVIGVDTNEELLQEAQSRHLPNAEFRNCDLRALPDLSVLADGLWCSFAAAYFPDLSSLLASWGKYLRPGGWIAITEIDDLFGHEPLSVRTRSLLEGYAADALATGRYDFYMGRKLRDHLERAGLAVWKVLTVEDQELSFDGPARPEVIDAWRARLDRMRLLHDFCRAEFEQLRTEFLGCLANPKHRSVAKVYCCFATK